MITVQQSRKLKELIDALVCSEIDITWAEIRGSSRKRDEAENEVKQESRKLKRFIAMMTENELLPGYDRPAPQVKVVNRELLCVAQQMARQHEGWSLANAVLREAYGK